MSQIPHIFKIIITFSDVKMILVRLLISLLVSDFKNSQTSSLFSSRGVHALTKVLRNTSNTKLDKVTSNLELDKKTLKRWKVIFFSKKKVERWKMNEYVCLLGKWEYSTYSFQFFVTIDKWYLFGAQCTINNLIWVVDISNSSNLSTAQLNYEGWLKSWLQPIS